MLTKKVLSRSSDSFTPNDTDFDFDSAEANAYMIHIGEDLDLPVDRNKNRDTTLESAIHNSLCKDVEVDKKSTDKFLTRQDQEKPATALIESLKTAPVDSKDRFIKIHKLHILKQILTYKDLAPKMQSAETSLCGTINTIIGSFMTAGLLGMYAIADLYMEKSSKTSDGVKELSPYLKYTSPIGLMVGFSFLTYGLFKSGDNCDINVAVRKAADQASKAGFYAMPNSIKIPLMEHNNNVDHETVGVDAVVINPVYENDVDGYSYEQVIEVVHGSATNTMTGPLKDPLLNPNNTSLDINSYEC